MQDDEAAQLRCKPILHTNNVTWVATPEHGRKVVLITIITTKEAYCALAHYVLPPLSTHKLCTNRSFVLGVGCYSVDGSELEVAVHRRRALGYEHFSAREFSVTQIASVVNRGRGLCPHSSLLKNGFIARVESLSSKGWELHYRLQFS